MSLFIKLAIQINTLPIPSQVLHARFGVLEIHGILIFQNSDLKSWKISFSGRMPTTFDFVFIKNILDNQIRRLSSNRTVLKPVYMVEFFQSAL